MKRKWLVLVIVLALADVVAGCGNLFAPKGCTPTIAIIDSIKTFQGADTTWHRDTLSLFKLCAQ